ncbi:MAG: SLC13 family permease, partial [Bacteroidota bacterium]
MGSDLGKIILGFMLATGFLSMWISNTATAVMMMPIGMAVVKQLHQGMAKGWMSERNLGQAMMLGIAYSSSIGGMATIIGTPTNVIFSGVIDELYGVEISFASWMLFGLPIAAGLLFLAWWYLTIIAFALPKGRAVGGGRAEIKKQLDLLGPVSDEERKVFIVFVLMALAWMSRSYVLSHFIPGISDTLIAMAGAISLFMIPSKN